MIKWLKNQGLSKLAFGFIALGALLFIKWSWVWHSAFAIFIYVNFVALLKVIGISTWWKSFWNKANKG